MSRKPKAETDSDPYRQVSRNVYVNGHRTSMRLELGIWDGIAAICKRQDKTVNELLNEISRHAHHNLTSAVRVYVASYFRAAAEKRAA